MLAAVLLLVPVFVVLVVFARAKSMYWDDLPEAAGRVPSGRPEDTCRRATIAVAREQGDFTVFAWWITVSVDEQGLFLKPGFPHSVRMSPVCIAWKFMSAYEDGQQMGVRRAVVHALGDRYRIALYGSAASAFVEHARTLGLPLQKPQVWERSAKKT